MSNVTNVLILTLGDKKVMAALTERREGTAWTGYFGDLSHKPAAEFWGHDGKWPGRKAVQVLIRGQDDDCWGLWMFVEGRLVEVDLPGATRLPLKVSSMVHDQPIEVEVGSLLRRPPPTSTSILCNADVYVAGGAWHFVIYADDLETAVAGTLPVTVNTPVESAQAAAVEALRERFGAEYDIVWRFERNEGVWWGDVVTATARRAATDPG